MYKNVFQPMLKLVTLFYFHFTNNDEINSIFALTIMQHVFVMSELLKGPADFILSCPWFLLYGFPAQHLSMVAFDKLLVWQLFIVLQMSEICLTCVTDCP